MNQPRLEAQGFIHGPGIGPGETRLQLLFRGRQADTGQGQFIEEGDQLAADIPQAALVKPAAGLEGGVEGELAARIGQMGLRGEPGLEHRGQGLQAR